MGWATGSWCWVEFIRERLLMDMQGQSEEGTSIEVSEYWHYYQCGNRFGQTTTTLDSVFPCPLHLSITASTSWAPCHQLALGPMQ